MTKYLVTVRGFDSYYAPSEETVTLEVKLEKGKTPIDWFISRPEVYSRFKFVPNALINFWKIERK